MEELETYQDEIVRAFNLYWKQFLFALPRLIFAVLLLALVFFVASWVRTFLFKRLSGKAHDPLFSKFIAQLSKFALIVIGVILALQTLGLSGVAGGLLAGAGISAFIFGFAFKDIAENF